MRLFTASLTFLTLTIVPVDAFRTRKAGRDQQNLLAGDDSVSQSQSGDGKRCFRDQCKDETLMLGDEINSLICSGKASCKNSEINARGSSGKAMLIMCSGKDSCIDSRFDVEGRYVTIRCTGDSSCSYVRRISKSANGGVYVECIGKEACKGCKGCDAKDVVRYMDGPLNTISCPSLWNMVMSAQQCQASASQSNAKWAGVEFNDDLQPGCYMDRVVDEVFLNSMSSRLSNRTAPLRPICMRVLA